MFWDYLFFVCHFDIFCFFSMFIPIEDIPSSYSSNQPHNYQRTLPLFRNFKASLRESKLWNTKLKLHQPHFYHLALCSARFTTIGNEFQKQGHAPWIYHGSTSWVLTNSSQTIVTYIQCSKFIQLHASSTALIQESVSFYSLLLLSL